MNATLNTPALTDFVARHWDEQILPRLLDYIRLPCLSPHFDPAWEAHGQIEAAIQVAAAWCRAQPLPGLQVEIVRLPGRTPLLFLEIPGHTERTVLFYGHLDKQPEMTGWREGYGPWTPVLEDGRLYGRGGADDGYAVFAALTALLALQVQGVPRPRSVALIECGEESGSGDLPFYLEALAPRLGAVELVIALDSGCGNYEQLWVTTSLRGLVAGTLTVEVLTAGVHSGDAGGLVPSTFQILRLLLNRLEDPTTGQVLGEAFSCPIPRERQAQARQAGAVLGDRMLRKFPWAGHTQPLTVDPGEAILNRTWRPALSIIGAEGLPPLAEAGNVLLPRTTLILSLRLPPRVDPERAAEAVKRCLETDPPYQAQVRFEPGQCSAGWDGPPLAPGLQAALEQASQVHFGRPAMLMGEGGTIPFPALLGQPFPQAQYLITGVLGPQSNAHGPNEFLHLPYAKQLTCCLAQILAAQARRALG